MRYFSHVFAFHKFEYLIEYNISASINNQQNGSNCPFMIASSVTLEDLYRLVAGKLGCVLPGLLKLCYRLGTDKAKASATSIQTEEELKIFKERMRSLIVPQRLANGKLSTRVLKPVTVCFEDSADSGSSRAGATGSTKSKTSGKKVCIFGNIICTLHAKEAKKTPL